MQYNFSNCTIWCNLKNGASDRNRTKHTGIFSHLLYRLSYRGKFSSIVSNERNGDPDGT